MKMKKGIIALFAVALLGVGLVSAYNGWMKTETHDSIESAIEAGDYDAWVRAHEAILTEDNFNLAVERHNEMQEERGLMRERAEGGCGCQGKQMDGNRLQMSKTCPFAN